MIDLRYVKKLLEMLDESTVDSMEISSDKGMRIRLSKTPTARGGRLAQPDPHPLVGRDLHRVHRGLVEHLEQLLDVSEVDH